jgi:hypothetical protein
MTNNEKALVYDNCVRESDKLQRENSKIKSDYAGNIPVEQQNILNKNDKRISELVKTLENLFN